MDYRRILGDDYRWPLRTMMVSKMRSDSHGEPTVLMPADFKGAELFSIAVKARDANMLDHCYRNMFLDESDPNFYDIHSHVTVTAFQLGCEPTKPALEAAGKDGLRTAAKNIIFGGNYGRTAEAVARQCQEEGVLISIPETQQIISTIYGMYQGIPILQEQLRARAHHPCWLRTCFGRLRRCIPTTDDAAMSAIERQFLNFLFQSEVADAVSIALEYLHNHPRKEELGYKTVLQIHDEIVLEVPVSSVPEVYDSILPECMEQRVSFYACDLNGDRYPDSPEYRFAIDRGVCTRWGAKLSWEECDELGLDRRFGKNIPRAA